MDNLYEINEKTTYYEQNQITLQISIIGNIRNNKNRPEQVWAGQTGRQFCLRLLPTSGCGVQNRVQVYKVLHHGYTCFQKLTWLIFE